MFISLLSDNMHRSVLKTYNFLVFILIIEEDWYKNLKVEGKVRNSSWDNMVILPACLPTFCSVECIFCFHFTLFAILQIIFLELLFSSFCLSFALIFCYFHRWWYKENSVKLLAIEELSEVQYLFTEENGNAISTEMTLIIVDNHLDIPSPFFPTLIEFMLWSGHAM